jgi:hypothetical protein
LFSYIDSKERNIILLGDFNLSKLFTIVKFDSYNDVSNKQYEIFIKLLNSIQSINELTLQQEGLIFSTLFLFLTRIAFYQLRTYPLLVTDHSTFLLTKLTIIKNKKKLEVCFKNFNKIDITNLS